jgi:hypothetical protein
MRAKPGEFDASSFGPPRTEATVKGTLRIVEFDPSSKWPTAAYIGLHQGPNRNESVQVLAIRNHPADDYMVVGFRHIAGGKEVEVRSLQNVPLGSVVRVQIAFRDGVAKVRANDAPAFEVSTALRAVVPYVSVSSGRAEFEVDA